MFIILILLVIGAIYLFQQQNQRGSGFFGHYTQENKPLEILRERYARGEIDAEEYQRHKQDLQ